MGTQKEEYEFDDEIIDLAEKDFGDYDKYDRIEDLLFKRRGTTKKKMCEYLGISYSTFISWYQRRSKNPGIEAIQKIAEYLGTTTEYILTGNTLYYYNDVMRPEVFDENIVVVKVKGQDSREYTLDDKSMQAVVMMLDTLTKDK